MKEIRLPYGEKELTFELPEKNLLAIAESKRVAPAGDELFEVRRALYNPIGGKNSSKLAKNGDKVAIIADSHDRPTPHDKIIPVILDELNRSGVRDEDVTIVLACGTIEPPTEEQMNWKFGKELLERINVVIHDCDDEGNLVFHGVSSLGTPIWINRIVSEADVKIGIGNIVPHMTAGYGGGAKIVLPGVSARETVEFNHIHMISSKARVGMIDENPVRKDMEEIARIIGLHMIVNTILTPEREIVKVVAGDVIKAHREGVKYCRDVYEVKVPRKADIMVTAPGKPYDQVLSTALTRPAFLNRVVKDKGTIIMAATCLNGLGFPRFFEILGQRLGIDDIIRKTWRKEIPIIGGGCMAVMWLESTQDKNVTIVSEGVTEEEARKSNIGYSGSIDEALEEALKRHGDDAKVVIVPHGALTMTNVGSAG